MKLTNNLMSSISSRIRIKCFRRLLKTHLSWNEIIRSAYPNILCRMLVQIRREYTRVRRSEFRFTSTQNKQATVEATVSTGQDQTLLDESELAEGQTDENYYFWKVCEKAVIYRYRQSFFLKGPMYRGWGE